MSRSNPQLVNPAQHFFEWKGGEGRLEFYDKEKQQRIAVPLPFEFLPLDQLATITGYSNADKLSFYSNEVRNTAKEEFNIKIKGVTRYTGLYKNNQGIAQIPKGANYTKSIYIAHKTRTGEYIIGNIKAAGSALGAWIEFNQSCKPENGKVIMNKGEQQQAATGPFYAPTFEYVSANSEENNTAIELDRQLQVYLSQYLAAAEFDRASIPDTEVDQSTGTATSEQVADYEARKKARLDTTSDSMAPIHANNPVEPEEIYPIEGEPINLDEIPF